MFYFPWKQFGLECLPGVLLRRQNARGLVAMDPPTPMVHTDGRHSVLVKTMGHDDAWVYGMECSHSLQVAFRNEGMLDEYVTLYDITVSKRMVRNCQVLEVDDHSCLLGSRTPKIDDFKHAHDVCCGMGGFGTAFVQLGGKIISAVDSADLAIASYRLNHHTALITADIGSTFAVRAMHVAQRAQDCQALLCAGFPCQPLSRQGLRRGAADPRSDTLPSILKAAHLLNVCAVILECVPEAAHAKHVQDQIRQFASQDGFDVVQSTLHLQAIWPSKRSRWFAVLVRKAFPGFALPDLPSVAPMPVVQDVIQEWPCWSEVEERQLAWTPLECQAYSDPAFGDVNRKVVVSEPLPTALHSWGNALYPCPCKCRLKGLGKELLLANGLRGILIRSAFEPSFPRHIHPKELQLLLGFPPFQSCVSDCRAALCLLGNSVSPVQALWVFAHLWWSLGICDIQPVEVLRTYLKNLAHQQNLSWPPVSREHFKVVLQSNGTAFEIVCQHGSTVQQLLHAQITLEQCPNALGLRCGFFRLPGDAYLRPLTCELVQGYQIDLSRFSPVKFLISHLGMTRLLVGAAGMKVGQALHWQGIQDWKKLESFEGSEINPNQSISPGLHVIVIPCVDTIAFDLAVLTDSPPLIDLTGYGPVNPGPLRSPASWFGHDLWHVDHVIRNHLLISWAVANFPSLTVWVPTFADAVLELWPSTVEARLCQWLSVPDATIFAILLEPWGWNLVVFHLDDEKLSTHIFEVEGCSSELARRLANRVRLSSNRTCYEECRSVGREVTGAAGSMSRVFELLEGMLGVPQTVAQALRESRPLLAFGIPSLHPIDLVSPTLSLDQVQMPVPPGNICEPQRQGLNAPFLLDFARALVASSPLEITSSQIRVLCLDPHSHGFDVVHTTVFCPEPAPLFAFLLCEQHWTLVHCYMIDDALVVTQYDGLQRCKLNALQLLVDILRPAWKPNRVRIGSTWIIEQTRSDSCGTVALGHFARILGLVSQEQASAFEDLHSSLAVCSRMVPSEANIIGYGGPDEEAIVLALEQILPSKGVPVSKVRERALESIKILGVQPLQKALATKNVWAALKNLGTSRPKPFMWILHAELQEHIQQRASSKFGASVDQTKPKARKAQKPAPAVASMLDPASLNLLPGIFVTNEGAAVDQIPLSDVQKNSKGVAFASLAEAKPFLSEAKFISTEALSLLVVGNLPPEVAHALPAHSVRVPAIYQGTQEPILVDCTAIQLGDQAVYAKQNNRVKEIAVFPTVVFRVHVFQDLWTEEHEWTDLASRPIKSLTQQFPILTLCRTDSCSRDCGCFHPSLEEEGVEAAILDTWGFHWHTLDGQKTSPQKATVLSFYVRVLESNFNQVHLLSGQSGVFFEPRCTDKPGPDPHYAVIWLQHSSLKEALHRVRTNDHLITVCRLGSRFGVRCLAKYEEAQHKALCPGKPFVKCDIKEIFRLEPLPPGLQRQSLVEMLEDFKWVAKPLQPCKGSQGHAWIVGAGGPPPAPFLQAKHGWVSISKVKDATPKMAPQQLIATVKTRQHIRDGSFGKPKPPQEDSWHTTGQDPWSSYVGVTSPPPPVATHVQSKLDDVEQRLQDTMKQHVDATLATQMTQLGGTIEQQVSLQSSTRLDSLEQQLACMHQHQQQLEHWCVDSSAKIAQLQHGFDQTQAQLQEQSSAIAGVTQQVSGLKEEMTVGLQSYFDQQAERIEAMLAKKARHN